MTADANDTIRPLDLVERLRLVAGMELAGLFAKDTCAEAADEIERLRKSPDCDEPPHVSKVWNDRRKDWHPPHNTKPVSSG
jgi:hypothetical protein